MSIITYTRSATCKDCKFLKYIAKRKFECSNSKSDMHTKRIYLKDLVCKVWEL